MSTLLIGVGLGALAAPSQAAPARSEAEDYKDITSPLVFMRASNPASPTNCTAVVFMPFQDLKGWDDIRVYTLSVDFYPGEPPFSDTFSPYPGVVWTAPAGTHWVKMAQGSSTTTDCSDVTLAQQSQHGTTGTMTYKITDDCDFARTDVRDAEKAVEKAQKKVKNTAGNAHDKAVAKLKQAKKDLKKVKKKFKKNCSY